MTIVHDSAFESATLPPFEARPAPRLSYPVPGISNRRPICVAALLGSDALALLAALLAANLAMKTVYGAGWPDTVLYDYAAVWVAVAVFGVTVSGVLVHLASRSHYNRRMPFWTEVQDLAVAGSVAMLFTGFAAYCVQSQGLLMTLPLIAWLMFPLIAMAGRKAVRTSLLAAGAWKTRTVLVAETDGARQALAALRSEPGLGYDVIAVVHPSKVRAQAAAPRWRSLLQAHDAELLVVCHDALTSPGRDALESLVRERVPFAIIPQFDGLPVLGFEQTKFFSHDTVMFSYRNNLARPVSRSLKIMFDCLSASALLVLLLPLLVIIAALVSLDGGPVLFGHVRVGAGGRSFRCLKFRSMQIDSDAALRTALASDPAIAAEWAQTQKLRRDPRITKIGRFLRMTSLDELPQLFNVLRLEMSLVGPRPIVDAEVVRYGDDIAYYYETRPGLTGLWQVSGRTGTSYAQRVQLDTWYVKNWSLWHDLAILAKTIPAVLKQRGAC